MLNSQYRQVEEYDLVLMAAVPIKNNGMLEIAPLTSILYTQDKQLLTIRFMYQHLLMRVYLKYLII
jgi:hypothetical protein